MQIQYDRAGFEDDRVEKRVKKTYAIGLTFAHLLNVGSPYAVIFLLLPSNSIHFSSLFT